MKSQSSAKMLKASIRIDDFADDPSSGRHQYISTITSTQVYKVIRPIVRKNMTHLFVYRLRNASDLEAWIEELSGVYDKKTLHQ